MSAHDVGDGDDRVPLTSTAGPTAQALRFWESGLFFGVPIGILALTYAGIAVSVGAIWPGDALVHESGRRTLVQTLFWLEHAVREIPIDTLLGAAVAGSLLRFWSPTSSIDGWRRRRVMRLAGGLTLGLTAFIVTGAFIGSGASVVLQEFAQMHTRPGAPPGLGNHWDTHLLSRFAMMLAAVLLAGCHAAVAGAIDGGSRESARAGTRLYRASLIGFLITTVLLVPNFRPFVDAVHIGHQARELFTHLLITLPLSYGAGLLVLRSLGGTLTTIGPMSLRSVPASSWLAGAGVVLIGAYLTVGFLVTAAYGQGQSNSFVALVLVHFFEHALTYLFTPVWTIFLCAWMVTTRHVRVT